MKKIIDHLKENWIRHGFETLVVTVGILGAFTLNNWNEGRKEETYKKQLLSDLRLELQEARLAIAPVVIQATRQKSGTFELLQIIGKKNHAIPVDTLKKYSMSNLYGVIYELTLSAYDEAKSSGRLSLIGHNNLTKGYLKIFNSMAEFRLLANISADMFFKGSIYELRKLVGDTWVLTDPMEEVPENYQLKDSEYIELTAHPIFYSAVENRYILNENIVSNLIEIDVSMSRVDSILHKIQKSL